jgi:hypothetical protein
MPLPPGTHQLGPEQGTLSVRTGKGGAAAVAGHNLLIEVGGWEAEIAVGNDGVPTEMLLRADGASLRVVEGSGGRGSLGDEEKAAISQTIDEEVLRRRPIVFSSREVSAGEDGRRLRVEGELELLGTRHPIAFDLFVGDSRLTASATVTQSAWGMKPYSALFGTLKVADDVVVSIDARMPAA